MPLALIALLSKTEALPLQELLSIRFATTHYMYEDAPNGPRGSDWRKASRPSASYTLDILSTPSLIIARFLISKSRRAASFAGNTHVLPISNAAIPRIFNYIRKLVHNIEIETYSKATKIKLSKLLLSCLRDCS
jgi:hypothetical protein